MDVVMSAYIYIAFVFTTEFIPLTFHISSNCSEQKIRQNSFFIKNNYTVLRKQHRRYHAVTYFLYHIVPTSVGFLM